jgi:hypothetical protein
MGDGVVEYYGCYFLIILLRRKFFDFTGAEFFKKQFLKDCLNCLAISFYKPGTIFLQKSLKDNHEKRWGNYKPVAGNCR